MAFKNKTGLKFGRLTVLRLAPSRTIIRKKRGIEVKEKVLYWECLCECKKIKIIVSNRLTNARWGQQSCGCLFRENQLKSMKEKPPGIKYISAKDCSYRALVNRYRQSARKRGFPFLLSLSECHELFKRRCSYCGKEPFIEFNAHVTNTERAVSGKITYMGIDRINNALGYTSDNVQSCCFTCNSAKSQMALDEFKEWVSQVYNFLSLGSQLQVRT